MTSFYPGQPFYPAPSLFGGGIYGNGTFPPQPSNYTALSVMTDGTQVRNEVFTGTGNYAALTTDYFTADGFAISWPLSHEPDTSVYTPKLLVSSVPDTVSAVSPGNVSDQFGLLTVAPGVVWLVVGTQGVPPAGSPISIQYAYQAPVLAGGIDVPVQTSAPADKLPTWGRIMHSADLVGTTPAQALADAEGENILWSYPSLQVALVFSDEVDTTGMSEGQELTVVMNRLNRTITGVITMFEIDPSQAGGGGAHTTNVTIRAQGP